MLVGGIGWDFKDAQASFSALLVLKVIFDLTGGRLDSVRFDSETVNMTNGKTKTKTFPGKPGTKHDFCAR